MATIFVDRPPTTCSILLQVAQIARDISSPVHKHNYDQPHPFPARYNVDRFKRYPGRIRTPLPTLCSPPQAPRASPSISFPPLPLGWERSDDFLSPFPSPFDTLDHHSMEEEYFNAAHFLAGARISPGLARFKLFLDEDTSESDRHVLEPRLVSWLGQLSAEEWRLGAQHIWLEKLAPVEMELKELCDRLIKMDEESGGLAFVAWRRSRQYAQWFDPVVWVQQAISNPPVMVTSVYVPNLLGTYPPDWFNREMWAGIVANGWIERNAKLRVVKVLREVASNIQSVLLMRIPGLKKNEVPNLWDFEGRRNDVDADAVSPKTKVKPFEVVAEGIVGLNHERRERIDSSQDGMPWVLKRGE